MNKKVLGMTLVLLTAVMLAAPLLGTAEACCYGRRWRKPAIATVEYSIQVWPALPLPADYEPITGETMMIIKVIRSPRMMKMKTLANLNNN